MAKCPGATGTIRSDGDVWNFRWCIVCHLEGQVASLAFHFRACAALSLSPLETVLCVELELNKLWCLLPKYCSGLKGSLVCLEALKCLENIPCFIPQRVVDGALKNAERMFWGYCFQCLFSNPALGSGGRWFSGEQARWDFQTSC